MGALIYKYFSGKLRFIKIHSENKIYLGFSIFMNKAHVSILSFVQIRY